MKYLLGSAFVLVLITGQAQKQFQTDHRVYLEQLGTAKDSLYKTILARYNRHIENNPGDYAVQLERCKLIDESFYNSYEDYNPNYEEAQSCVKELSERFPDVPEVLLYKAEFMYGDSLVLFLKTLETKAAVTERDRWKEFEWDIYYRLANHYRYSDQQSSEVIHYGILAAAANDTLDLSIMLAEAYKEDSDNETAIEVLLAKLDSTDDAWELNQKGRELLALGKPDEALRAFRWAAGKGEDVEDAGALAQAMIDQGIIEDARPYLLKDYIQNTQLWQADSKLRALLSYDLRHGSADSAVANYRKLTDEKFVNDAFGIYRLRLFAKAPLAGWSFADIGRLLLLVAGVCLIFIIPYVWILPLHYWGSYWRNKGHKGEATFEWGLRHLWVAGSLWLLCDVLASLLFDYEAAISVFSDEVTGLTTTPPVSAVVAHMNVFFMAASTVFVFAMVKSSIFNQVVQKFKTREIWMGVALAFLLRVGLFIYVLFLKSFGVDVGTTVTASAITDAVISVNTYYSPWLGLLFVVLLVPVYEEILFRGIFLSAAQRNLSFVAANILQSLAFATVHQDLTFFPFYFAFGMLAGHFTRATGSLVTSISMHMVNNLLAFVAIVVRS